MRACALVYVPLTSLCTLLSLPLLPSPSFPPPPSLPLLPSLAIFLSLLLCLSYVFLFPSMLSSCRRSLAPATVAALKLAMCLPQADIAASRASRGMGSAQVAGTRAGAGAGAGGDGGGRGASYASTELHTTLTPPTPSTAASTPTTPKSIRLCAYTYVHTRVHVLVCDCHGPDAERGLGGCMHVHAHAYGCVRACAHPLCTHCARLTVLMRSARWGQTKAGGARRRVFPRAHGLGGAHHVTAAAGMRF